MPKPVSHSRKTLATISELLSERMCRQAVEQHGFCQSLDPTYGVDPPCNLDGQAFAGELVDQGHQTYAFAIMGLGFDKVEAPDVIGKFRSQPNARSIIKPKTSPFWLFLWDFQPFTTPDSREAKLRR